jgi:UDP-N-acetylmuramate dehydrogenase
VTDWRDRLATAARGEWLRDAPLAPRTSIRIGGPADLLARPADPDALCALLAACASADVPASVLGGGANLLVADRGVRGAVVKLPAELGAEEVDGERLVLPAGAPTSRLVQRAAEGGLTGCEFISGIPGTLGGAVAMNAGTQIGEMKDVVTAVEVATPEGLRWIPAVELGFAYRTCRLPPRSVATRVEVRLRRGDLAESTRLMRADRDYRRRTQPLDRPSWGSTFRNPPGDHAGRLLEAAGLRGHRLGRVMFSELHANFVVNLGGATAREALALVRLGQRQVRERFGVALELEVRLMGEFEPEDLGQEA